MLDTVQPDVSTSTFALLTTHSWAITLMSGKAQLARPVYIHFLNQLHQV